MKTNTLFDFLFRRHSKELSVFCKQRADHDLAEDLLQEAFLRILQHPEPDAIENPRAFLYQTIANLSVDVHRKQVIRNRVHCHGTDLSNELANVADRAPVPEDQLADQEELLNLNALLLELPEITRYVFVLHRLEGLSHKDIATRLSISVRNSERHLATAAQYILLKSDTSFA